MLFYERRKKKPLKALQEDQNKAAAEAKAGEDKKEELCTEVDYSEAVTSTEKPSTIFG